MVIDGITAPVPTAVVKVNQSALAGVGQTRGNGADYITAVSHFAAVTREGGVQSPRKKRTVALKYVRYIIILRASTEEMISAS